MPAAGTGQTEEPPQKPVRAYRYVTEAPYWAPGMKPYESPAKLKERLRREAPDWYQAMIQWRKLRARDLYDIDLLSRTAAHARSWVEASHLYPPQAITATTPLRALCKLTHPPAEPQPALDKEGVERLRKLARGLEKIHPDIVKAEEAQYLSEEIFEELGDAWGVISDPAEFVRDVLWTYPNIQRRVREKDAPSSGAWTLLHYARENKEKFFAQIWPKALEYQARITNAKLQHERELKKIEVEAEVQRHRANEMSDAEAKELAATLDLMKELGVPYKDVARGIKLRKEAPPELVARMETES
jgi:hypothetical protein